jgi:hypothetical protein
VNVQSIVFQIIIDFYGANALSLYIPTPFPIMKRSYLVFAALLFLFQSNAQSYLLKNDAKKKIFSSTNSGKSSSKKYGSLLWEISGKGMKQPSYLFGTMHVSNKLASNLGDTFYNALKSVETVSA